MLKIYYKNTFLKNKNFFFMIFDLKRSNYKFKNLELIAILFFSIFVNILNIKFIFFLQNLVLLY